MATTKDKIVNDDDVIMARIVVDDYAYSFSLMAVSESSRKWMLSVVGAHMREVHHRAYEKGKEEIRRGVKTVLGIREG